jgi:hypothetical protein
LGAMADAHRQGVGAGVKSQQARGGGGQGGGALKGGPGSFCAACGIIRVSVCRAGGL